MVSQSSMNPLKSTPMTPRLQTSASYYPAYPALWECPVTGKTRGNYPVTDIDLTPLLLTSLLWLVRENDPG
ncbi:hypothetical protein JTE90_028658 [Oedothorax gibbosus]|uniref:Uncharacterized protein n=1 Tax=Oedothorax gibbosus TaxID=931172 RepID=A0AAV6UY85_9ARAC|nr:hypothetical protein JTE90_028658 [Oedothorax gibbosus]